MSNEAEFDIYLRAGDRALRLATSKGAGLPAHVKSKDWIMMRNEKSLVHSDANRDIAAHGFCLYRIVDGDPHEKG